MTLLSDASHVERRVESKLRWEMKVAIKLYLCKSEQYKFYIMTNARLTTFPAWTLGH